MRKELLQLHFLIFLSSFIPTVAILIKIPAVEIVFYRTMMAISDEAARRDLNDLVAKGVLKGVGKGRNIRYKLAEFGD
ncbi:MAG: hypothetical protein RMJ89_06515 [Flammeovirgaceae bacterium]|nr:hypothetical protein [Flammeovirgaceae bacterium]